MLKAKMICLVYGIPPAALAKEACVHPAYIRSLLNGAVRPGSRMKRFLSERLGVPEAELFREVDPAAIVSAS